jgi:hypothetical protein
LIPVLAGNSVQRTRTETPASGKHFCAERAATRDAKFCRRGTFGSTTPHAIIRRTTVRRFSGLAGCALIANPRAMSATDPSKQVLYLGQVDSRADKRIFGILREDRFSHLYMLGKTGTGKSTFLENMALQDLEYGNGFALIDPHGELAKESARPGLNRQ